MKRVRPARTERALNENDAWAKQKAHGGPAQVRRPRSADVDVVERARCAYVLSGRRSTLLGSGLFADPGWNMLLDLLLSEVDGNVLSVTSACIGSRASHSTALRHMMLLRKAGLVERVPDGTDRRRTIVRLTDRGWEALHRLFQTERSAAAA